MIHVHSAISALEWTTDEHLDAYLRLWPNVLLEKHRQIALETLVHHRLSRAIRIGQTQATSLEKHWYTSLMRDVPDYAVYDDVRYVGELWACWILYSRRYLRDIVKLHSAGIFRRVHTIADLGCGLGYSTAALAQLWPQATVYGTNLDGPQARAAREIGTRARFTVEPEITGAVDLIFASEYFEHFDHPYDHLKEVLIRGQFPHYLILASTFGTRSVGHFDVYYDEIGNPLPGNIVARGFNARLRRVGYRQVETGFWNNRPSVWERQDA